MTHHVHCSKEEATLARTKDLILEEGIEMKDYQSMICGFVVISAILAILATSGYASSTPTPEFVSAALINQEQVRPILDITYTYGRPGSPEPATFRYVRTPGLLYAQQKSPGFQITASFDRTKREFRALQVAGKTGDIAAGEISDQPGQPLCTQSIMETTLYNLYDGPLYQVVAVGSIADQLEEIDGRECWRVESPSEKAGRIDKYVIWVDPAIGFCPRRLEIRSKQRDSLQVTRFTDYTSSSKDFWFPSKIHYLSYKATATIADVSSAPEEALKMDMLAEIQHVGKSENVSLDDLIVRFPTGTEIHIGDSTYKAP